MRDQIAIDVRELWGQHKLEQKIIIKDLERKIIGTGPWIIQRVRQGDNLSKDRHVIYNLYDACRHGEWQRDQANSKTTYLVAKKSSNKAVRNGRNKDYVKTKWRP